MSAMDMNDLDAKVRSALESSDTDAMLKPLDPAVHWGPAEEPERGCHERHQAMRAVTSR